ncbi:hypothetical protein HU200_031035 [Digitaria exilis]|uniref:ATPase AAA-type core domain-containing protein n=1 Tax=Digitaria exilis TaxID=1010633 RepID=A0A835BWD5_9POAL|nr:hypothetical protein HU200_031035 [Digitaria exilis]
MEPAAAAAGEGVELDDLVRRRHACDCEQRVELHKLRPPDNVRDAGNGSSKVDDLDMFRSNRDFYRRTGMPWKRGYPLYGPPGTGKSTMIAAMANYLNYDIYDIELTNVHTSDDLRKLLI